MKRFVFIVASMLCIVYGGSAQNYYSLTAAQTNKVYTGFEAVLDISLKLHNSTPTIKNYTWERTDICQMPSGWNAYVCDCDNCYPPAAYIKPGQGSVVDSCSILFTYQFDLGASLGSHTTKLRFHDPTNTAAWDEIFLTVNNGCPTSMNDRNETNSFVVNLNNSGGQAYLQGMTESYGLRITVSDISGRIIESHYRNHLSSCEKVFLEVSHAGIYFVNVFSAKGQKISTYKMIKP